MVRWGRPPRAAAPPASRARLRRSPVLLAALALGAALVASAAQAQSAAVQGFVTDRESARSLAGAIVALEQEGRELRSTVTDRTGLYQIAGVAPGTYRLRIRALGYAPLEETISLAAGQRLTASRRLAPNALRIEGVEVTGQGPGAVRRELGGQAITSEDMARVPTPAAAGDLASYLQTMPGVVGTGDRGGQLFIRGGTPSDNLALMDGMLIYQPFHITGFFSAFPEDLVERAEFMPGGFGPRYSGRISSVLDVTMREGNRNRQVVAASASPFLADVRAEGPLGGAGSSGAYIVSVRRSLIEETSPWLLGQEQPVGFRSYYLKLSGIAPDGGSRCSFTALRSSDRGRMDAADPVSRVGWSNQLLGGRCSALAGEYFIDARFGQTGLESEAITRGASEFTSSARRVFLDADASRTVGRARLNFGTYLRAEETRYDLLELLAQGSGRTEGWMEFGMYAELDLLLGGGVRLLPGVTKTLPIGVPFEPRLRASWRPSGLGDAELSGALGWYGQRIAGLSDRRDAGSVFTAWMQTPADTAMRAMHAQASWQQSIGAGFSYSVDAFYRRMQNLPVATWSTVARFNPELALAHGHARGGDARVEYRRGRFYGFGGYGYSWTRYESAQEDFGTWFGAPVQRYHPAHDRRHQVNALASLRLGPYSMAARWEYGSGFPFTRPRGFDEWIDYRTDDTELPDVRSTFGDTRVLLDRPFNARMPAVHRLDLSVERVVRLGPGDLQLQAGVINAYDRGNIFFYDVFTSRRIDQLPLAPYLSLRLQPRAGGRR